MSLRRYRNGLLEPLCKILDPYRRVFARGNHFCCIVPDRTRNVQVQLIPLDGVVKTLKRATKSFLWNITHKCPKSIFGRKCPKRQQLLLHCEESTTVWVQKKMIEKYDYSIFLNILLASKGRLTVYKWEENFLLPISL